MSNCNPFALVEVPSSAQERGDTPGDVRVEHDKVNAVDLFAATDRRAGRGQMLFPKCLNPFHLSWQNDKLRRRS